MIPLAVLTWIKRREVIRAWDSDSDPTDRAMTTILALVITVMAAMFGPILPGLALSGLVAYGLAHIGIRLLRHGITPEGATDLRTDHNHPKGVR